MSTRTGNQLQGLCFASILLALIACGAEDDALVQAPVRVDDSSELPQPLEIDTGRTSTPGDIATTNLSSQIDGRLAFLDRRPDDLAIRGQVVGLLLSRAHYTGSFSDFDAALTLAEGSAQRFPDRAEPYEQLASVHGALHLFAVAAADIDRAEAESRPGTDLGRFEGPRVVSAVATGAALDDALAWARAQADAFPSYASLAALATVEAAYGRYEDADRHYVESLELYRDVSPFPLAFVAFQRGVMWAEMADRRELAAPLYREALRRVPTYVVANVHLAELEANLLGDPESAIDRLRTLVGSAEAPLVEDPEPLGLLGALLAAEGETAEAAPYIEAASAMYDDLLSRHPEAFADHGAEFFAGPGGDPARAVRLSQDNLDLRSSPRAFIVAIGAALAADDERVLCATVTRTENSAQSSANLRALLAEISSRCSP